MHQFPQILLHNRFTKFYRLSNDVGDLLICWLFLALNIALCGARKLFGVWLQRRTQEKGKESEMGSPNSALEPCRRNDGRRWRCKSAAVPGTNLCGHHLVQSLARKRRSSSSSGVSAREGASTNKKAQKKLKS
ncbi:uncharacterized protein LOC109714386 [Ananas comosus]|uniref:Uncharacterized protein LOC109714386 n=1 Tax=Ananas comosus TaxID=4615 RepID=A0A6P5FM94_ANACO|nr:uncharacterized protein LOC109714386 [Ananas comosus]